MIEDIVCSLELSKKLKEFGLEQKSLFYWEVFSDSAYSVRYEVKFLPYSCPGLEKYSAFTSDELLELLPNTITTNKNNICNASFRLNITRALLSCDISEVYLQAYKEIQNKNKVLFNEAEFEYNFITNYINADVKVERNNNGDYTWPIFSTTLSSHNFRDKKLSNALAKTYIYLKEKGLINVVE